MTTVDPHAFRDMTSRDAANDRVNASPAYAWSTNTRVAVALVTCVALAQFLTLDRTLDVWRTGAFFDTDDATRALQLRQWLAGQDWYDLAIGRMAPPNGVFMHWSRVVDVPLAALTFLARPFLDAQMAERLVRLVFPASLFVALMLACGYAATALGGARARVTAIVLAFLGAPFLGQFVPGRIDHHAPQIVLLVLMTGAMLRAFDANRARGAAIAGLCAAMSLAISLENLAFIALIAASLPLAFVAWGDAMRRAMIWFAGAFAASLVILFFATLGPAHWMPPACDAYSLAHLAPGLVGCGALAILAVFAARLKNVRARTLAVIAVAPLPIVAILAIAPNCLGDPFVGLDPLVRDIWLHNVGEVEPLPSFLRTHFWSGVAMLAPLLCAAVLAAVSAARATGITRAQNIMLAALIVTAVALTFWGIRVFSSGLPLVAIVAAPFVVSLADRTATTLITRVAILSLVAIPFAPLPLALALPSDATTSHEGGTLACLRPEALAPVAKLAPGTMLAPIDAGAHLLALTPHSVFGAAYHRDNFGNRLSLDALLAPPDVSRDIIAKAGVDYVAICRGEDQARIMAERASDGLAAALVAGRTPAWLTPLDLGSPMRVFRVKR